MDTILEIVWTADAYYRLSKEDGDKAESDSIVNQKALVREFLKVHPDIQIYEEKVDDGFTGVSFERPSFQTMMEDIKSGKVNCVIVKDLSRFGRNYIEAGRYIEQIFPYLGVRFIAINDNIDTLFGLDASEQMLIPFKNLINDAYCRDISVKVRSHLDIKRKNGQYISPFAPYGYRKSDDDKNKLVVEEEAASVVRQIFRWKIEGMSGSRIADRLNEMGVPTPMEYKHRRGENIQCGFRKKADPSWTAGGVNRILQDEVYTGTLLQGKTFSPNYKVRKRAKKEEKDWIRCEDCHEAIISAEEFRLVKASFAMDTRVSPKEQAIYLFSGIAKCGHCGGNMTRKTIPGDGKNYVYLVCVENKNKNGCTNNKRISLEKLEKVVLRIINLHIEKVFEISRMAEIIKKIPYSGYRSEKLAYAILEKEREIEKRQRYSADVYVDYKEGVVTREEYLELKESFQAEIVALQEEIKALEEETEKLAKEKEDKIRWVERFVEYRGVCELSRELLMRLVEDIRIYDKDRVEVNFKFRAEYEELCDYVSEKSEALQGQNGGTHFK